jgi:hypothetical protein
MNIEEGARRMKRAGQWMVVVPFFVMLLVMGVVGIFIMGHPNSVYLVGRFGLIYGVALIYLEIPGWVLWLAGWIMEGFAKNPD